MRRPRFDARKLCLLCSRGLHHQRRIAHFLGGQERPAASAQRRSRDRARIVRTKVPKALKKK
jgi:hypothetical protein